LRNTPYTTKAGVQIGIRHNEAPKPMPIDDPDMELIQSWFICSKKWHKQRNIEVMVIRISASVLALLIIVMWMAK